MRHRWFQKSNPSDLQINLELCHITEIIAVCKDSYVVYSVDLTEWEWWFIESVRITINTLIFIYLCHLALDHRRGKTLFFMWFLMILTDSRWFLNKCEIDFWWFLLILESVWNWFSLILADSQWLSVILNDSWWFLPILNDSWISLNPGSHWFSLIHNGSHWFSVILSDSRWFSMILK